MALDQASRTGWAVGTYDELMNGRAEFGVFVMLKRPNMGERLKLFREGLIERIEFYKPDALFDEEPFFPVGETKFSLDVIRMGHYIHGFVMEVAASLNLPFETIKPSDWRMDVLGYARKPKGAPDDHMKKAMQSKARTWGYEVEHHDESDALGILRHVHNKHEAEGAQGDLMEMMKGAL